MNDEHLAQCFLTIFFIPLPFGFTSLLVCAKLNEYRVREIV